MNYKNTIYALALTCLFASCSEENKLEEKGFSVGTTTEDSDGTIDGILQDSVILETRPSTVLLTGIPQYRLTTVYKVNYTKEKKIPFIGTNDFHYDYSDLGMTKGNQWNNHFMPGFEAVFGYNMVNVSHYNTLTDTFKNFFQNPVLIKTFYYPANSKDTLNFVPVNRNFFMVSVYDEDTNNDGFINIKDLRRFYFFDINAENQRAIVPNNYSVVKSEHDTVNDFMYIFAQLDANENGRIEMNEATHVFWIDLKNPEKMGRLY